MQEPVFAFPLALDGPGAGGGMRRLHAQLRAAIVDQRLPAGSELPATRRVAAAYGIARNSVIAAYDLLIAEGYVVPRSGACAVVAPVAGPRRAPAQRLSAALRDPRLNPAWRVPSLQPERARDLPPRSFRLGVPEHRFFPHDVWRRITAQALRAGSRKPFAYGPSAGIEELRHAIARHVAFARAVVATADDVVVTSGAQQAFDLLARLLVRPGRTTVAVEEPGYPPLRAAFIAAGARLVPVPVDDEGLCVERLPRGVRVISVTPSHQSPTGVALSLRRRRALLDFAARHDASIIEDDYDGEFRFGARPLDALQMLDRDARVFYVGTFSKSLFPALRKGFVVAPAWARDALVAVKHCTDSHSDTLTQTVLAAFIRDGHLARYVRRMQPVYAERRDALLRGIARHLARWFEPVPAHAGLHLAARVRTPERMAAVAAAVQQFAPGAQSTADYAIGKLERPAIAFGYGVIDAESITPALLDLRRALERS